MVQSDAATVEEYIASLPPDRREAVSAIREVILKHLPDGYEEGMQYGMIGYYVPLSRLAKTYNGQPLSYAALASQKNYISVYLNGIYADPDGEAWFRAEYAKTGRKPNMGKSCVRFRKPADVPLDLIGQTIAREPVDDFIAHFHASRR
jgi:uncharacterized protein YdhG (YjbR/CyaY superfamily)